MYSNAEVFHVFKMQNYNKQYEVYKSICKELHIGDNILEHKESPTTDDRNRLMAETLRLLIKLDDYSNGYILSLIWEDCYVPYIPSIYVHIDADVLMEYYLKGHDDYIVEYFFNLCYIHLLEGSTTNESFASLIYLMRSNSPEYEYARCFKLFHEAIHIETMSMEHIENALPKGGESFSDNLLCQLIIPRVTDCVVTVNPRKLSDKVEAITPEEYLKREGFLKK